jgi:hypothetical protein
MSSPGLPVHDGRPVQRIVSSHRPYWIPADSNADEPQFDCFMPPAKLRGSIAYLWTLSCRDSRNSTVEFVSPDAGIELIYRLGHAGEMLVRGPQRCLTTISIDPLASYVGVRIRPEIAQRLTGFSVAKLPDCRLLGGTATVPNRADAPPIAAQVAFVTRDMATDWQRAVGAGATIVKEPEAKPWGQTAGYLRDINGSIVELSTPSPRDCAP